LCRLEILISADTSRECCVGFLPAAISAVVNTSSFEYLLASYQEWLYTVFSGKKNICSLIHFTTSSKTIVNYRKGMGRSPRCTAEEQLQRGAPIHP